MPKIISVIGKSNSGKTTFIEKLIPVLKKRGYTVGTVKHAFHHIDIDKKRKDSWRHSQAGADTVIVVSQHRTALIKNKPPENLDALLEYFNDVDIVITEGYKRENKPQIEVYRKSAHKEPLSLINENLIAFVTDAELNTHAEVFGLDDAEGVADLIERKYL